MAIGVFSCLVIDDDEPPMTMAAVGGVTTSRTEARIATAVEIGRRRSTNIVEQWHPTCQGC
jgi:hypothetical protein